MSPYTPAIGRFLHACDTNNVIAARSYLGFKGNDTEWVQRGLKQAAVAHNTNVVELICTHVRKVGVPQNWGATTASVVRAMITNNNSNVSAAIAAMLLETGPIVNAEEVAAQCAQDDRATPMLALLVKHLDRPWLNKCLHTACICRTESAVELLLPLCDVQSVWDECQNTWMFKADTAIGQLVTNHLQHKLLSEIVDDAGHGASKRKM